MQISEVIIHEVDLKKLRKQKGLSLRQLSKLSGVSYPFLTNCENGRLRMSNYTWEKIQKTLDNY